MFEPITSKVVARLSAEAFYTAQLTLVSIIQGLSFTLVVQNSLTFRADGLSPFDSFKSISPYVAISLFAVVVISYLYFVFAAIFRGPLTIWDFLIPFFIGFAESAPTFYFSVIKMWWLWVSVCCLGGVVAYIYTLLKVPKKSPSGEKNLYKHLRMTICIFILLAGTCTITAAEVSYLLFFSNHNEREILWFLLPIFICQVLAAWFCSNFVVKLRNDFLKK